MNSYLYVEANPIGRVDENWLYAEIEYNNENVLITLPIVFTGEGANSDTISAMKRAIESMWSRRIGKYNVKMKVIVGSPGNTINIPLGGGRAYVMGVGGNTGVWPQDSSISVAPHEVGHLMGLTDRYKDNCNGISIPLPGWENNIMATLKGIPDERNIEALLDSLNSANKLSYNDNLIIQNAEVNILDVVILLIIFIILTILKDISLQKENYV